MEGEIPERKWGEKLLEGRGREGELWDSQGTWRELEEGGNMCNIV